MHKRSRSCGEWMGTSEKNFDFFTFVSVSLPLPPLFVLSVVIFVSDGRGAWKLGEVVGGGAAATIPETEVLSVSCVIHNTHS